MSHYSHIVAIPGDVAEHELEKWLSEAMAKFDENVEVSLHRDESPYAEPYAVQLEKAKAYAAKYGEPIDDDAALVRGWEGTEDFDVDGWPMTTRNPDGHWDYWRVGGRWAGEWILKDGSPSGPLQTEHGGWDSPPPANHDRPITDSARKRDLEAESIRAPYSWLDLGGVWHTKWIGPSPEEATGKVSNDYPSWEVDQETHSAWFFAWLAGLPDDTWLVHLDYHK